MNETNLPRLDHVAFQVSDLERAIKFYTEKLGLKFLFKKVDEAHGEAFAYLEMEGANLELLQMLGNQPAPSDGQEIRPPYCPHLAFRTDNLERQVERLKRENIEIVSGPLEIAGSVRWLYIHDPDHNIIEFIEYLSDIWRS